MTKLLTAALLGAAIGLTACGPRQVDVRTAPSEVAQVSVEVRNTLNQGVNVYVVQNGTKTFLRQVGSNSTVTVPVQGFAAGTTVRLEATTIDGVRTFSRDNVTLSGNYVFPLP